MYYSTRKMDAFAYISILETALKLIIVYMIYISPYDKLITYTILYLASSCLIRYIYTIYCKRNFEECQYELKIDKSLLKEMTNFAGWNFLGIPPICSILKESTCWLMYSLESTWMPHGELPFRYKAPFTICQQFHHRYQSSNHQVLCHRGLYSIT